MLTRGPLVDKSNCQLQINADVARRRMSTENKKTYTRHTGGFKDVCMERKDGGRKKEKGMTFDFRHICCAGSVLAQ